MRKTLRALLPLARCGNPRIVMTPKPTRFASFRARTITGAECCSRCGYADRAGRDNERVADVDIWGRLVAGWRGRTTRHDPLDGAARIDVEPALEDLVGCGAIEGNESSAGDKGHRLSLSGGVATHLRSRTSWGQAANPHRRSGSVSRGPRSR